MRKITFNVNFLTKLVYSIMFVLISVQTFGQTISISAPSLADTNSGPVTYTITYSGADAITLVNSDVTLNKTGTADGNIAVSGSGTTERTVTISNITGEGLLGISIASGTANDNLGNSAAAAGPSATFNVDSTQPTNSISAPSLTDTNSGPVTYTISYSGADAITLANNDVTLNKTGTADGNIAVSGSGITERTVTISNITGDGTLGISIASGTANDNAGNLSATVGPSTIFNVDNTAPTKTISAPSLTDTNSGPVAYTISYSGADAITLANNDVTLNKTGTADGNVAVSGSGTTERTVTISNITGDGTLGISIASETANDNAGNLAAAVGPSATFNVDNTAPSLSNVNIISDNANPLFAKSGDQITLTFTSSETINTPTVTIDGKNASVSNTSGNNWSATITTDGSENEGLAAFQISGIEDTIGNTAANVATLSNGNTGVTIDFTPPSGYSFNNITNPINIASVGNFSFEILGLEANATYNFTISDADGNTNDVTGNGTYNGVGQVVLSPVISSLTDGVNTIDLTFYATDAAGNQGQNINGNTSKDTQKAVITLIGDNPQIIDKGTPYIELGATGTDNLDGNITGAISIDISAVDINTVDCYPVTYTYTDNHGNTATVTRIVWILEHAKPYAKDDVVSVSKNSTNNTIAILNNDSYGLDGANTQHAISGFNSYTDLGGKLDLVGNNIIYTPRVDFIGVDTFSYKITDGSGDASTAIVTINVNELSVPTAYDDVVDIVQATTSNSINVLANDFFGANGPAANGSLTVISATTTQNGSVVVNGTKVDYTPLSSYTGTDTFTYRITDANGDSSDATVTINVTPVNPITVPIAKPDTFTVAQNSTTAFNVFADNSNGIDSFGNDGPLDNGLTLPSGNLTGPSDLGGTIAINQNGTANPTDDTITYTPKANFFGTDSFKYMITDSNGDTSITVVTINVLQTDSPLAVNDNLSVTLNSTLIAIDVLDNDTFGADGPATTNPLTIASATSSQGGTIAVNNGKIDYTPANGFTGTDTFTYTITDFTNDSDVGTVTIQVGANVVDKPTAQDDTVTVIQNSTNNDIEILIDNGNGTDSFGTDGRNLDHPISLTSFYTDHGGELVLNGDIVEYTPASNFTGTDTFNYIITDENGDADSATVTITVNPTTTITVTNDSFTVSQDSSNNSLDIFSNDIGVRDGNGDPLVAITGLTIDGIASVGQALAITGGIIQQIDGGVNSFNDDTFNFTPTAGTSGQVQIPYTVSYATGASSGTITINITPKVVLDVPIAKPDAFTNVPQNSTDYILNVLADNGNGTDEFGSDNALDNGLTLPNGTLTGPSDLGGTITVNQNGTLTTLDDVIEYTPAPNFFGNDGFKYMITDGNGDTSITVVTIVVTQSNVPNAIDDAITINQDSGATTIDVLANDTFGANGPAAANSLSITAATSAQGGTIVVHNGKIDYTPLAGFNGPDSFSYVIEDFDGNTTSANVTITVLSATAADFPTAYDDVVTVVQNSLSNVINILNDNGNGADTYGSDGPNLGHPVSLTAFFTDNGGELVLNGNTVVYTPATDFIGTDSFRYIITDKNGDADDATVTITVQDPASLLNTPTANNDAFSVAEDSTNNILDILDNDSFGTNGPGFVVLGAPSVGNLNVDNKGTADPFDDVFTYTPPASYNGVATFNYTIEDSNGNDNNATVTITVGNTQSPGPVAFDDDVSVNANSTDNIINILNDNGNGADTYGAEGPNTDHPITLLGTHSAKGAKIDLVNNTVKYTPVAGFIGTDNFSYFITDAKGNGSNTATVTVTVGTVVPKVANTNSIEVDEFTAYPNPSKGYIKTEIKSTKATKASIYLMDLSGKVVFTSEVNLSIGNNLMEYNFNISPGIMLLKIISKDTNFGVQKLIFN